MSANKLYLKINNGNNQCRIDLCGSWIKIHKLLQKIGISRTIYDICMNDNQLKISVDLAKGNMISTLADLIHENDKLIDIHLVCKLLEYGDKEFITLLPGQLDTYSGIKEILDDYLDFILYKTKHMNIKEKEDYDHDYLNHQFEVIQLFGMNVLYTEDKIPNQLLPLRIFHYEVRNDVNQGGISQLGKSIRVHHGGTILSNYPIKLDQDGYRDIDEKKDVVYPLCPFVTLKQYMNEYKTRQIVFPC